MSLLDFQELPVTEEQLVHNKRWTLRKNIDATAKTEHFFFLKVPARHRDHTNFFPWQCKRMFPFFMFTHKKDSDTKDPFSKKNTSGSVFEMIWIGAPFSRARIVYV